MRRDDRESADYRGFPWNKIIIGLVVIVVVAMLVSLLDMEPGTTRSTEVRPVATSIPRPGIEMERIRVSEDMYGDDWPLIVSSGWVTCKPLSAGAPFKWGVVRIFIDADGNEYGLNGHARAREYTSVKTIQIREEGIYRGTGELVLLAGEPCGANTETVI